MKENIIILIIALTCMSLAGAMNGIMDTISFHYSSSIFPQGDEKLLGADELFWNPSLSWRNKYKNGDPAQGEKFLLSTGALVLFTDAWHLAKFMMLSFFQLAMILPLVRLFRISYWWSLVALLPVKFVFASTFTFLYGYWLVQKGTEEIQKVS